MQIKLTENNYSRFTWVRQPKTGAVTIRSVTTGLAYYWLNGRWNKGGKL